MDTYDKKKLAHELTMEYIRQNDTFRRHGSPISEAINQYYDIYDQIFKLIKDKES